MTIIDELSTTIKFDVPASSKSALDKTEKSMDGMSKRLGRLGSVSEDAGKSLAKLSDRLSGIAIGATTAGMGLASAFTVMTLYEGKQANALKNLSDSLGLNASEASVWSAAIKTAGGNAEAFKADLQKLNDTYGSVAFDDILKDADELSKFSLPEAMFRGKSWGYGEDSIRFLHQGSEGIRKALEGARSLGQGALQKHIDQLAETNRKYQSLSETIGGVANRIAGESAPSVGRALDTISKAFVDNQASIDEWAAGTNNALNRFLDGLSGNIDKAANKISGFNGQLSADNARSPDPEIRKQEVNERKEAGFWKATGANAGLLWDITAGIFGAAWDTAAGTLALDPERIGTGWESAADRIGDSVARTAAVYGEVLDSIHEVAAPEIPEMTALRKADEELRRRKTPERLHFTEKPEIKFPEQLYKADLDMLDIVSAEMAGAFDHVTAGTFRAPSGNAESLSTMNVPSWKFDRMPTAARRSDFSAPFGMPTAVGRSNFSAPFGGMSGNGGTTIQHQANTIHVTGTDNPEATAQKTMEALILLGTGAPNNGFAPHMQ